jgi:hypothetical protein
VSHFSPGLLQGLFGMNIYELNGGKGTIAHYVETTIPFTILTVWIIVAYRWQTRDGSPGNHTVGTTKAPMSCLGLSTKTGTDGGRTPAPTRTRPTRTANVNANADAGTDADSGHSGHNGRGRWTPAMWTASMARSPSGQRGMMASPLIKVFHYIFKLCYLLLKLQRRR